MTALRTMVIWWCLSGALASAQAPPQTPAETSRIGGSSTTLIGGAGQSTIRPPARWIFILGDSKAALNIVHPEFGHWQDQVPAALIAKSGVIWTYLDSGVGSQTVASYRAIMQGGSTFTGVPALQSPPAAVLFDLGVNDSIVGPMPTQANWKSDWLIMIDLVRTHWPNTPIYIMTWWGGNGSQPTDADTEAGWMADMIAARANVYQGPDERIWYKGADNGATNTYDGTHQSLAGNIAETAAWMAVLWP